MTNPITQRLEELLWDFGGIDHVNQEGQTWSCAQALTKEVKRLVLEEYERGFRDGQNQARNE